MTATTAPSLFSSWQSRVSSYEAQIFKICNLSCPMLHFLCVKYMSLPHPSHVPAISMPCLGIIGFISSLTSASSSPQPGKKNASNKHQMISFVPTNTLVASSPCFKIQPEIPIGGGLQSWTIWDGIWQRTIQSSHRIKPVSKIPLLFPDHCL